MNNDLAKLLSMTMDRSVARNAKAKRQYNVEALSTIDRSGLEFGIIERKLLIHTSTGGEKVYIQYPGKETKNASDVAKVRPWDFRPRLFSPTGEQMKDLSFGDIWDDLATLHGLDKTILSELASVFYRMASMVDCRQVVQEYAYEDIELSSGSIVATGTLTLDWYAYSLDDEILNAITSKIPTIRGVSLLGYLIYNYLLVQNEDCKYFYRDVVVRSGQWELGKSLNNTLLSHISVIEFLKDEITFSQIMTRFQRGMGIAKPTNEHIEIATGGIIKKT